MKYKTLNPVMHDGTLYPEGKALELYDTDADTLLACGAIDAVDEAAEATEPEPVKPAPKQKGKGKK